MFAVLDKLSHKYGMSHQLVFYAQTIKYVFFHFVSIANI